MEFQRFPAETCLLHGFEQVIDADLIVLIQGFRDFPQTGIPVNDHIMLQNHVCRIDGKIRVLGILKICGNPCQRRVFFLQISLVYGISASFFQ